MFEFIIQHILANLPVWFWPAVAGAGVVVYCIASALTHFPLLRLYAWPVKLIGFIAFVVGVFMFGGAGVTAIWQEQVKQAQAKVDASVKESKSANDKLTQVRKQKNKVIVQRQVVIHERIVKDAAKMDATCKVDPVAIKDLNDAAINPEVKK
jgi:hypothetical protein